MELEWVIDGLVIQNYALENPTVYADSFLSSPFLLLKTQEQLLIGIVSDYGLFDIYIGNC